MRAKPVVFALVATLAIAGAASALTVTRAAGPYAASASFEVSGDELTIVLSNISQSDVMIPPDVLTAVFFHMAGNPALTPVSAHLTPGSQVFFDNDPPQPVGGDVSGEWAFRQCLSGLPCGGAYGISSAGLDIFGPHDLFPGTNLDDPPAPDGLNYGIVSEGDDLTTGNVKVTGATPLIQSSVTFKLTGVPLGFDPTNGVSNVWFQYGTSFSEPVLPPPKQTLIPEPVTAAGMAMGAFALAGYVRRRRRAALPR